MSLYICLEVVYFTLINSFVVWDASLFVTVGRRKQCLVMIEIENGLERGFVKHRLNCLLITDPKLRVLSSA